MEELDISARSLAKRISASESSVASWLAVQSEPNALMQWPIGEVIGEDPAVLFRLLGLLPDGDGHGSSLDPGLARLEEAVRDLSVVARAREDQAFAGPAALFVDKLLDLRDEAGEAYSVTGRVSLRGNHYRAPWSVGVGVSPKDFRAPAGWRDIFLRGSDHDRKELSDQLRTEYERFHQPLAGFMRRHHIVPRSPRRAALQGFAHPGLVSSVSNIFTARPRATAPNTDVPHSICIVGLPYAGGPDVAALLAGMLGFIGTDLHREARRLLGRDDPADQALVAKRLLADPGGRGRHMVWSMSSSTLNDVLDDIPKGMPLVISLRTTPKGRLERYVGELHARERYPHSPEWRADTQRTIDRMISATGRPSDGAHLRHQLTISDSLAPDNLLDSLDPDESGVDDDVNALFDVYVGLAIQAAEWLHSEHGGPGRSDAEGLLGLFWRTPTAGRRRVEGRQSG